MLILKQTKFQMVFNQVTYKKKKKHSNSFILRNCINKKNIQKLGLGRLVHLPIKRWLGLYTWPLSFYFPWNKVDDVLSTYFFQKNKNNRASDASLITTDDVLPISLTLATSNGRKIELYPLGLKNSFSTFFSTCKYLRNTI